MEHTLVNSSSLQLSSSLLSFVQDGVGLTGKVFFEEDGANQYNPVVLALGVFSKQNNNLFDTLNRDVFVKGTDYDICIKLMERLLEAIQEEEQKTSGNFSTLLDAITGHL